MEGTGRVENSHNSLSYRSLHCGGLAPGSCSVVTGAKRYKSSNTFHSTTHKNVGTEVANSTAGQTFQRQPQALPHTALHEIYHDELLTQGRGLPLWIPGPTPSLPQAYRQDGISVGDVGIIRTDGPFDFLFNILLPADHAVNSMG